MTATAPEHQTEQTTAWPLLCIEAEEAGADAYRSGKWFDECPYTETHLILAWGEGWNQAAHSPALACEGTNERT